MAPPRTRTVPVGFSAPPSKRVKRLRTTGSTIEIPRDTTTALASNVNTLRKHVYEQVIGRLQRAQAVVSGLSISSLEWMLPSCYDDSWESFLTFPMLTTDLNLQAMMQLERSTAQTPAPPSGSTVYYVRSFQISTSDLRAIIAHLKSNDVRPAKAKIEAWEATLALSPNVQTVFIRYVGLTQTVSAYSRFVADSRSRDGLYGAFVSAIRHAAPSVLNRCKVYTFPQAAVDAFKALDGSPMRLHHSEIDSREQALIELFGRASLINRRTGGIFNSYQPSDADIALFSNLNTQSYSKLETLINDGLVSPPDAYTKHDVADYVYEVRTLGEGYPEELGVDGVPVTDAMEQAWREQASYASCYGSSTIFLLIGDYLPLSAMHKPAPYWKQTDLRSVRYMKDTLSRLRAVEQNRPTWDDADLNRIIAASLLPFVDFQYTPKHNARIEESTMVLRNYMASAKPIIVMTFEKRTAAIVGTNFVGAYSGKHLTPIAGIPRIRYYTDPGEVSHRGTSHITAEFAPDPDDCFIQIPSVHPGSMRYEEVDAARQLLDMTQWQLCLGMDVVLDLLAQGFGGDRALLCKIAIQEMERRWSESGCAAAMVTVKSNLQSQHYDTKKGRFSAEPERQWKKHFDGEAIAISQVGIITLYWELPDGSRNKVNLSAGRDCDVHPPKDAEGTDKIRTIHFTPDGIDIRKADGTSCTFTKSSHAHTDPTFDGELIRDKVSAKQVGTELIIDLWEWETGLVFASAFPSSVNLRSIGFNAPSQTAKFHKPPSRKNATISKSVTAASAQKSAATKASRNKAQDDFIVSDESEEEPGDQDGDNDMAPPPSRRSRKKKLADLDDEDNESLDDFIVSDDFEESKSPSTEFESEEVAQNLAANSPPVTVVDDDDDDDEDGDVVRPPSRLNRKRRH